MAVVVAQIDTREAVLLFRLAAGAAVQGQDQPTRFELHQAAGPALKPLPLRSGPNVRLGRERPPVVRRAKPAHRTARPAVCAQADKQQITRTELKQRRGLHVQVTRRHVDQDTWIGPGSAAVARILRPDAATAVVAAESFPGSYLW